ncbi:MAG: UPF0223 family protein [Beduini sp.]|uniref:UPF0223 family protein n=1 Tax=Beduini sp. TaxID=1922300 RepID=UPI0039A3E3D0
MDYEYPFENDWSMEEIVTVISFYNCIEKAYEEGIARDELMDGYREFKKVVDSKALEKQLDQRFKEASSYSIYETMKQAKENDYIRMKL